MTVTDTDLQIKDDTLIYIGRYVFSLYFKNHIPFKLKKVITLLLQHGVDLKRIILRYTIVILN